jgi:hypothetical protein
LRRSRSPAPARGIDVEAVRLWHRIKTQHEPVSAGNPRADQGARVERDLRAPVRNLGTSVDREQMPLPSHRRIDGQPADAESADIDVESGSIGAFGSPGPKLGRPPKPRLGMFSSLMSIWF